MKRFKSFLTEKSVKKRAEAGMPGQAGAPVRQLGGQPFSTLSGSPVYTNQPNFMGGSDVDIKPPPIKDNMPIIQTDPTHPTQGRMNNPKVANPRISSEGGKKKRAEGGFTTQGMRPSKNVEDRRNQIMPGYQVTPKETKPFGGYSLGDPGHSQGGMGYERVQGISGTQSGEVDPSRGPGGHDPNPDFEGGKKKRAESHLIDPIRHFAAPPPTGGSGYSSSGSAEGGSSIHQKSSFKLDPDEMPDRAGPARKLARNIIPGLGTADAAVRHAYTKMGGSQGGLYGTTLGGALAGIPKDYYKTHPNDPFTPGSLFRPSSNEPPEHQNPETAPKDTPKLDSIAAGTSSTPPQTTQRTSPFNDLDRMRSHWSQAQNPAVKPWNLSPSTPEHPQPQVSFQKSPEKYLQPEGGQNLSDADRKNMPFSVYNPGSEYGWEPTARIRMSQATRSMGHTGQPINLSGPRSPGPPSVSNPPPPKDSRWAETPKFTPSEIAPYRTRPDFDMTKSFRPSTNVVDRRGEIKPGVDVTPQLGMAHAGVNKMGQTKVGSPGTQSGEMPESGAPSHTNPGNKQKGAWENMPVSSVIGPPKENPSLNPFSKNFEPYASQVAHGLSDLIQDPMPLRQKGEKILQGIPEGGKKRAEGDLPSSLGGVKVGGGIPQSSLPSNVTVGGQKVNLGKATGGFTAAKSFEQAKAQQPDMVPPSGSFVPKDAPRSGPGYFGTGPETLLPGKTGLFKGGRESQNIEDTTQESGKKPKRSHEHGGMLFYGPQEK